MNPAHIVLLLGVTIAVVAIAGHLIAIILILKHVVNRLNTILGGVEATTRTSQPVEALIRDINADLDVGRRTMQNCVARIEERRVPVGTAGDGDGLARHARHAEGSSAGTVTAQPPPAPPTPSDAESDSSEWPPPSRGPAPPPPPGPLWDR